MNGALDWIAAASTIVAAAMVAGDFGRRVTGWGFVLFVVASAAWIATSVINGAMPLVVANGILLVINAWGVWQYLLNPRKKREIEKAEEIAEEAEREVAAEEQRSAA
jgi:cbb3-type cytochrome oxidase subunit 3